MRGGAGRVHPAVAPDGVLRRHDGPFRPPRSGPRGGHRPRPPGRRVRGRGCRGAPPRRPRALRPGGGRHPARDPVPLDPRTRPRHAGPVGERSSPRPHGLSLRRRPGRDVHGPRDHLGGRGGVPGPPFRHLALAGGRRPARRPRAGGRGAGPAPADRLRGVDGRDRGGGDEGRRRAAHRGARDHPGRRRARALQHPRADGGPRRGRRGSRREFSASSDRSGSTLLPDRRSWSRRCSFSSRASRPGPSPAPPGNASVRPPSPRGGAGPFSRAGGRA